jgi:hypothetical protein
MITRLLPFMRPSPTFPDDGLFWWQRIDPDHLRLTTATVAPAQIAEMLLSGLLVHVGTLSADGVGLTAVKMIRLDEPDSAVAVPVVVPVHECRHPAAGHLHAEEWTVGIVLTVFHLVEQRF